MCFSYRVAMALSCLSFMKNRSIRLRRRGGSGRIRTGANKLAIPFIDLILQDRFPQSPQQVLRLVEEQTKLIGFQLVRCTAEPTDIASPGFAIVKRRRDKNAYTHGRLRLVPKPLPYHVDQQGLPTPGIERGKKEREPHSPPHIEEVWLNSSIIWSRMMNFCGLPVTVIGSSSTMRKWRGTLKCAI